MARPIATLSIELEARMAKFESDLKRANRIAFRQSRKLEKTVQRAGKNMVRALGIGGGVVAFTAGMRASVGAAVEFEKAMDEVSTLVSDTTNMDALTDSVRDMSREFGKAPVEQAKALYQIISAGAETAAEQMSLLTASNKLAIGGVTEVSIAADALTTILNAYGLEASEATDISDLLFVGMKQGKTTIEEMGLSIGKVATIAAQTGVPINELIAGVATLTKSGIDTSEAMSGLRGALSAVLKQSPQSVSAANDLGVAFNLQALEAKGLAKFLDDIQVAANGDAQVLQKLFGRVEGLTAVMSLGANGAKEFNAILEETEKRAGATDEAFGKMAKGSAFLFDKLKVNANLLAESIGAKLLPTINTLVEGLLLSIAPTKTLEETMSEASIAADRLEESLNMAKVGADFQVVIDAATKHIEALEKQFYEASEAAEGFWNRVTGASIAYKKEIDQLKAKQKELFITLRKAEKALADVNEETKEAVKEGKKHAIVVKKTEKEIKSAAASAKKLEAAYKSMAESLDPLVRLENDFNDSIETLVMLLSAGRIDREQFDAWLQQIKQSFHDAQLAAMGFDTELEYIEVTAKRILPQITKETIGMAAVIENSFKRLDDTFQTFWSNMLKNGKFSLKSIKDLFLDTIAQMLHAAITQPLVMKFGAMFTGQGGALGNTLGGVTQGAQGQLGGISGALGLGAMAVPIIGWIVAAFMTNLNLANSGWIPASAMDSTGYGASFLAGGGTPLLLDKLLRSFGLGGKTSAILSGTAIFAALFGRKPPKIISQGVRGSFGFGGVDAEQFFNLKAKGGIFRSTKYSQKTAELTDDLENFFTNVLESATGFATNLADMAGVDIKEILDSASFDFDVLLDADPEVAKGQLEQLAKNMTGDLLDAVLVGFSQGTQDFVNQFEGVDQRAEALSKYVTALSNLGIVISNFAATDPLQALAEYLEESGRDSTRRLHDVGIAMLEAMDVFDNTPEQLNNITSLVSARYRAEIEYLLAIDNLIKGIAQSVSDQQARIREAVEGPRSFSAIFGDAQSLLASLAGASSPEQIAAIVSQIQSLVDKAFGGLDESGQSRQANMLIGFLDQVQAAAEERANILAQMVIAEGEVLRDQALIFAESISAPMELNIQATQDVTTAVNDQTDILVDEGRIGHENQVGIREAIDALNDNFQKFFDSAPRTNP